MATMYLGVKRVSGLVCSGFGIALVAMVRWRRSEVGMVRSLHVQSAATRG